MAETIGLVIDQLVYEYQAEFWHGVSQQAQEMGVNLVVYVGSTMNFEEEYLRNQNKIYDFVSEKRIKGAIILTSSVTSRINFTEKKHFLEKIAKKCPIVSVGETFKEYASIGVDNRKGLIDAVHHLINVHNKKNIAFIGGPHASDEAHERLEAYKEALKKNNIPFKDSLFFEGNFIFNSGVDAIKLFMKNNVTFDAVVAANDWMAFGAMQELKHQGLSIPEDIAVTGFDDVESAYVTNPPLSTVKQPVFDMGVEAVKTIIKIIRNVPYEMHMTHPTEFIIRDSCGCLASEGAETYDADHYNLAILEADHITDNIQEFKNKLVESIKSDMEHPGKDLFLNYFNKTLSSVTRIDDIGSYHTLISEIREILLSHEAIMKQISRSLEHDLKHTFLSHKKVEHILERYNEYIKNIESMLHRARQLVSRKAEQLQFMKYLDTNNQASQVISIGQHLLTTYNTENLFSVIDNDFPTVDIFSCAIVEFMEPEVRPVSEKSRMVYYYNSNHKMYAQEEPFETETVVPEKFMPDTSQTPWVLIISSLIEEDKSLGYVVYESHNRFGLIYEAFSSEIASALKAVKMYQKSEQVARAIQARSDRINILVTPMLESIFEVTDLSGNEIKTIENLSEITTTGLDKLKSTNEILSKTLAGINQMLQMIKVIDDISSNINILALNASIESARAGAYGLGFQVIAEQIKGLSESTAQNTKNITEAMKKTIKHIKESNEASQDNFAVFSSVKDHVEQVTHLLTNVTNKMNELSNASNDILTEIKQKI